MDIPKHQDKGRAGLSVCDRQTDRHPLAEVVSSVGLNWAAPAGSAPPGVGLLLFGGDSQGSGSLWHMRQQPMVSWACSCTKTSFNSPWNAAEPCYLYWTSVELKIRRSRRLCLEYKILLEYILELNSQLCYVWWSLLMLDFPSKHLVQFNPFTPYIPFLPLNYVFLVQIPVTSNTLKARIWGISSSTEPLKCS